MTESLDLEPIKARLAALAICDGPIFPKADWQAEMEALVAEVERLRWEVEFERDRGNLFKRAAENR